MSGIRVLTAFPPVDQLAPSGVGPHLIEADAAVRCIRAGLGNTASLVLVLRMAVQNLNPKWVEECLKPVLPARRSQHEHMVVEDMVALLHERRPQDRADA
jgi:hypothetical protein